MDGTVWLWQRKGNMPACCPRWKKNFKHVTIKAVPLGGLMPKQLRMTLVLGVTIAISLFISACGGNPSTAPASGNTPSSGGSTPSAGLGTPGEYTCVQGSATASGSTALAPLVQAVAKDYQAKCSGASITVNLGGSKTGLSQVESGAVQIGNSDVFASKTQSDLVDHQVAVVIFALGINSKVTGVTNLTSDKIKSIYSGSINNWNQVGGPNLPIVVISRPASSGTRATFQQYILGGPETISGPSNLTTDSTGTVIQNIKSTDGAIGYVALGPAKKASLNLVSIDGNAPTPELVKNNTYKFWNIEHMYTKGKPTDLAQALIDYMASAQGKQEAASLNFVPLTDMSPNAVQAHQPKS
jgi:phosphate transport system substrate-binding protein